MSFALRLLSSPTRSLMLSSVLAGACAALGYQLGANDTTAYAEGFARARIVEVQAQMEQTAQRVGRLPQDLEPTSCAGAGEDFSDDALESLEAQETSAPRCPAGSQDTGKSCSAPVFPCSAHF